jgi:lysophospholipase L1-like esterase
VESFTSQRRAAARRVRLLGELSVRIAVAARLRRLAVALVAAGCAVPLAACSGSGDGGTSASASSAGGSPAGSSSSSGSYLALGDSVPFGFRGSPGTDYSAATNFTGYPELVGKELGLDVVNAACPGETTASFRDVTAQSNGCENTPQVPAGYRTVYPLHTPYESPTQSQLDFAVSTLKKTAKVSLVTLQVGANDAFICQQTTPDGCLSEIGTVAQTVGTNVDAILAALRDRGGYRGKIVVVTYYALNYADADTAGTQILDGAIATAAKAHDAVVADGFATFRPTAQKSGGDSVAAGLVISGDVHPTDKGQQLLAGAVEQAVAG